MEGRKPDCAKCGEHYGCPTRGLCSYCYDTWRRENGYWVRREEPLGPRNPNEVVDRILKGDITGTDFQSMEVPDALIVQLKALLRSHSYTPRDFLVTIREVGIVEGLPGTPLKLFTAKQAAELLNERKTKVHDGPRAWIWEHAICHLVADHWNISAAEFKVGHCYYADRGIPPRFSDDIAECRTTVIEKYTSRLDFMHEQISRYG